MMLSANLNISEADRFVRTFDPGTTEISKEKQHCSLDKILLQLKCHFSDKFMIMTRNHFATEIPKLTYEMPKPPKPQDTHTSFFILNLEMETL